MADAPLTSIAPYCTLPLLANAGIYRRGDRVFLQGAVELAPKTEITDVEAARVAAEGEAEEFADPTILSGLPPEFQATAPTVCHLITVYQLTTPGCDVEDVEAVAEGGTLTLVTRLRIPPGLGGELRLALWCWWDGAQEGAFSLFFPERAERPFSEIDAKQADSGPAHEYQGSVLFDGPYEFSPPLGGPVPVASVYGAGGQANSGVDAAEGYTVGSSPEKGRALLYTRHGSLFGPVFEDLAAGVFKTDRYTYYDPRPIPPGSKPTRGKYTTPGFARTGRLEGPTLLGLSGPTGLPGGATGMTVHVGDLNLAGQARLNEDGEIPAVDNFTSIALAVPPAPGGNGFGYYRFDLIEGYLYFQSVNWEPEPEGAGFNEPVTPWGYVKVPVSPSYLEITVSTDPGFPAVPPGFAEGATLPTNYFDISFGELEEGGIVHYFMYDPSPALPGPEAELEPRSAGILPKTYGDAGVSKSIIGRKAPLWVASYPLPPWRLLEPGDHLDLTDAGYAVDAIEPQLQTGVIRSGVVR